jgi:hypothetical protein
MGCWSLASDKLLVHVFRPSLHVLAPAGAGVLGHMRTLADGTRAHRQWRQSLAHGSSYRSHRPIRYQTSHLSEGVQRCCS